MSKKETEIQIVDTENGVDLLIGKKVVRRIIETESGKFDVETADEKHMGTFKTYAQAEEEAIRSYNLYL
ncbi:MAG: DUF2969 domain-containing protein [Streptococcaceae bacterium]|jgi:hypothetical protein|nr:DUF2969 domain-containing protein [Streptococcaceae bacterium]